MIAEITDTHAAAPMVASIPRDGKRLSIDVLQAIEAARRNLAALNALVDRLEAYAHGVPYWSASGR